MCIGGGGGGDAQAAAEAAERQRQREITRGTTAVNQAFAQREPQYQAFVDALRQHFLTDAQRQKEVADRQLRFSLARGGLTRGSAAADAGTDLGREFQEGIMQGERQAQAGLADLRARDEQTRMNLLSMVQGGMGATSAAQQAANAMRSNIGGARSEGMVSGLGNIFGGTADLYRRQQEAAQRRRGVTEAERYSDPFSR